MMTKLGRAYILLTGSTNRVACFCIVTYTHISAGPHTSLVPGPASQLTPTVLQENYVKLKRDADASEVLLLAVREQLAVREGELSQCQQELGEQKGRCSSMEVSMNLEVASRERTERELQTAYMQRDATQGQLDRCCCWCCFSCLCIWKLCLGSHTGCRRRQVCTSDV